MTKPPFKEGDKVETIHGEKLVVVEFQEGQKITKKGKVIHEGRARILAMSGGHPTWFPLSKIKN